MDWDKLAAACAPDAALLRRMLERCDVQAMLEKACKDNDEQAIDALLSADEGALSFYAAAKVAAAAGHAGATLKLVARKPECTDDALVAAAGGAHHELVRSLDTQHCSLGDLCTAVEEAVRAAPLEEDEESGDSDPAAAAAACAETATYLLDRVTPPATDGDDDEFAHQHLASALMQALVKDMAPVVQRIVPLLSDDVLRHALLRKCACLDGDVRWSWMIGPMDVSLDCDKDGCLCEAVRAGNVAAVRAVMDCLPGDAAWKDVIPALVDVAQDHDRWSVLRVLEAHPAHPRPQPGKKRTRSTGM